MWLKHPIMISLAASTSKWEKANMRSGQYSTFLLSFVRYIVASFICAPCVKGFFTLVYTIRRSAAVLLLRPVFSLSWLNNKLNCDVQLLFLPVRFCSFARVCVCLCARARKFCIFFPYILFRLLLWIYRETFCTPFTRSREHTLFGKKYVSIKKVQQSWLGACEWGRTVSWRSRKAIWTYEEIIDICLFIS